MNRSRAKIVVSASILFSILTFAFFHYHTSALWSTSDTIRKQSESHPVWLIATSTPAHAFQRRHIIRSTWQTLFRNDSLYTARFVIANPTPLWEAAIQHENSTFGDLIVLRHLEESSAVANTIKSIEFLKYLTSQNQNHPWKFVSKVDDDSFLDPNAFYHNYLVPILGPGTIDTYERTIIGRGLKMHEYEYPGGQFYTMSWSLAQRLSALHRENPITNEHEDVLVGRLLFEAQEMWNLIVLPNSVSFDYNDEMGSIINGTKTAWAKENADLNAWVHAVGPGAINPHKMRGDEEYLRVAECYDANGLKDHFTSG